MNEQKDARGVVEGAAAGKCSVIISFRLVIYYRTVPPLHCLNWKEGRKKKTFHHFEINNSISTVRCGSVQRRRRMEEEEEEDCDTICVSRINALYNCRISCPFDWRRPS